MTTIEPTICFAARATHPDFAALHYRYLGLSVLPCNGKVPAIDGWRQLQHQPATGTQLMRWADAGLFGNVGIICGEVSGNLAVIDLDGDKAVEAFALQFPKLYDGSYSVISGSGHGRHIYFYCDELPPTTRVSGSMYGGVELRANGCYVVAPPSTHPTTGKPYVIARYQEIARVANLKHVVEWIKLLIQQKHGGTMPPAANVQPVRRASPWAAAALDDEVRKVSSAPEGSQNNQLNLSAFKMGQLVTQGVIDRAQVESALFSAAQAGGYVARDGEAQTRRTLKSGLDAGLKKPRT